MYGDKNGHGGEHSEGPTSPSPSLITIDPYMLATLGLATWDVTVHGLHASSLRPTKKGANYI